MKARNLIVRLLAALADATPAFRAVASRRSGGRGRRLLAGLADATPAFTTTGDDSSDEYAPPTRTSAPQPGGWLRGVRPPEDTGKPREGWVGPERDVESTLSLDRTAQLAAIENTLLIIGFGDDRGARLLMLELIRDDLGSPLPIPGYVTGPEQLSAIVEACWRTTGGMNALVKAVAMMRPGTPEVSLLRTLVGADQQHIRGVEISPERRRAVGDEE